MSIEIENRLKAAYDFFNENIFYNELPEVSISIDNRGKKPSRHIKDFLTLKEGSKTLNLDQIVFHRTSFEQGTDFLMSRLVFEMVSVWSTNFANKPGRKDRTDLITKERSEKMEEIGLVPSDTGEPGGAKIGQGLSFYLAKKSAFKDCLSKYKKHFGDLPKLKASNSIKTTAKTKYSCYKCGQVVWGNDKVEVDCRRCKVVMTPE